MIDERELVRRAVERLAPPEPGFERMLRRRDRRRRNERIAGAVAGVAVVAAVVWAAAVTGPGDLTSPPASSGRPEPSVAPVAAIPGLPPEGAIPSAPEHGELVLRFDAGTAGVSSLWVYEDGRVISWDFPLGATDQPSTGLAQQRLTPEGIDFLRSRILVSGLFDQDRELLADDHAPFLSIVVRNGDRLVEVRWAWRGALQHPETARPATAEQADALDELRAMLSAPTTWPSGAWTDQTIRPFVPFTYAICLRGVEHPAEASRILPLLPDRAQRLLADADHTGDRALRPGCFPVTTKDARALVGILDEAGVEREASPPIWLRYDLDDPEIPGNVLWVMFEPVLPDGESTFLGPA